MIMALKGAHVRPAEEKACMHVFRSACIAPTRVARSP